MKKKIDEITQILSSEIITDVGLLSGIGGQILTCSELFLHNNVSQEWLSHLHNVLEGKLGNEEFLTSHCNGLAGIGWLYEYLSQRKAIDYNTNTLLEEADQCLENALKSFLWQGNYDFLHGGVGVALYFAKRAAKKKELVSVLNQFLEDLEKISTPQENGTRKWLSFLGEQHNPQYGYNISLSHGMASIVAILAKLYNIEGIDREKTEKLLRGATQYILAQEIDKEQYGSYFSSFSLESASNIYKSRLAWCYGDLGISSAIYQAGKVLQNQTWIDKAIEILLYAAKHRKLLVDNSVWDAGLCHGAAGIGHMFYRAWWNTKLPQFKEAADYWFTQTLQMAKFEDGLAGFKTFLLEDEKPAWENNLGFLEGISGIGLAMLTYYNEMEPAWDECLLLS